LLFMTTSSKPCLINHKSRLCVSWICLLPLISSIILFSASLISFVRLTSMANLSDGSHHTCHQAGSWSLSTPLLLSVLSRSGCPVRIRPQSSLIYSLHYS